MNCVGQKQWQMLSITCVKPILELVVCNWDHSKYIYMSSFVLLTRIGIRGQTVCINGLAGFLNPGIFPAHLIKCRSELFSKKNQCFNLTYCSIEHKLKAL